MNGQRDNLMPLNQGQDRVSADARALLDVFVKNNASQKRGYSACVKHLKSLPLFVSADGGTEPLHNAAHHFDAFLQALSQDMVNSTAAMQVRTYRGDCFLYPVAVLMEATAIATSRPASFHEDCFLSVLGSLLNTRARLHIGRYESANRPWSCCVANVGEGKSDTLKYLRADAEAALKECGPEFTVGVASDNFQFMESATNATVLEKARFTGGCVCIACGDASRMLDKASAKGKACDLTKKIDLEFFLDSAHGEHISHQNMDVRRMYYKSLKDAKTPNPSDPHAATPVPTELKETNIVMCLMTQEAVFMDWFAQIAYEYSVGIPQRFCFSFGGDCDPASAVHNKFYDNVTRPILKSIFKLLIRACGPKQVGSTSATKFECTSEQNVVFSDMEESVTLQKRTVDRSEFKAYVEGLPKCLYWMGTYTYMNHLLEQLWPLALTNPDERRPVLLSRVSDQAFVSAIHATERKFLFGMRVLGVTVKERAWIGRHTEKSSDQSDVAKLIVLLLRSTPEAVVSIQTVIRVDLGLKRRLRDAKLSEFHDACAMLRQLFAQMADLGVGELYPDTEEPAFFDGQMLLRKFRWQSMPPSGKAFVIKNRIPSFMFGGWSKPTQPTEAKAAEARSKELPLVVATLQEQRAPVNPACADAGLAPPADTSEHALPLTTTRVQQSVAHDKGPRADDVVHRQVLTELWTEQEHVQKLRSYLHSQNDDVTVKTAHPQADIRVFRATAKCKGTKALACPVQWDSLFYKRRVHSIEPGTWVVTRRYLHNHTRSEPKNSGKALAPQQSLAAQKYISDMLSSGSKPCLRSFREAVLLASSDPLPENDRVLSNFMHRELKKQRSAQQQDMCDDSARASFCSVKERTTLDAWLVSEPSNPHALQVKRVPAPSLETHMCVLFSCDAMEAQLSRFESVEMALSTDVKQKEMTYKEGVCDLNLLTKDRLRTTTFGKHDGKKVQGRAFTTHAVPILNGAFNVEGTEHFVALFRCFKIVHNLRCPDKPDAVSRVLQLHSDYAPAIEAARRIEFPNSRPVKDFFHLMQHCGNIGKACGKTLASKMNPRNMVDKGHGYRTLNQGRILGHLQCERHLPSAHLYSALWQGSLLKIRWVYDEEKAAAYLGPGGEATHPYTWRMAAKDLQRPPFNIHCFGDDDEIMLFSPHWSGIGGILEGTDCGDQCSEALHSAWQAEKQRVADAMPKAKGLDVLNNMQTLYDTAWKSWFGWEKPSALYAFPRGEDPNVLNGASLSKAGRSHAIALWTASQSKQIHAIFDIGDRTQVVAMVRDLSVNFSPTDAEAGSRMLFASGQELQTMLEHDGLVQWVQCIDDNLRLCTAPERVNDVFVKRLRHRIQRGNVLSILPPWDHLHLQMVLSLRTL